GARTKGQPISLCHDSSIMAGQTTQGPIPGPQKVGEPIKALPLPGDPGEPAKQPLLTGADGTVTLALKAGDPGNPRGYIDGQVYGIAYGAGTVPPPVGSIQNHSQILNVLVWSGFTAPKQPDWLQDVQPVLQQYANLYPIMLPVVDLGNYASIMSRRQIMKNVF